MEGVTSEMRRMLDIDKLQEDRGKRRRRIKNDPAIIARRKQYAFKRNKKDVRTSSPSPVVPFAFESRENIISQIIDLMCRVGWQDYELRNVWTVLENLRNLLPAGKEAAA